MRADLPNVRRIDSRRRADINMKLVRFRVIPKGNFVCAVVQYRDRVFFNAQDIGFDDFFDNSPKRVFAATGKHFMLAKKVHPQVTIKIQPLDRFPQT